MATSVIARNNDIRSTVIKSLFEEYAQSKDGGRPSVQELNTAARRTLITFSNHRQTMDKPTMGGWRLVAGDPSPSKVIKKLTLTSFAKCLEFCGLKTFVRPMEASLWATHQDGSRHISVDYILYTFIDVMAWDSVWWMDGHPPEGCDPADPRVRALSYVIRRKLASKAGKEVLHLPQFDPIGDRLSQTEIGHVKRTQRVRMFYGPRSPDRSPVIPVRHGAKGRSLDTFLRQREPEDETY